MSHKAHADMPIPSKVPGSALNSEEGLIGSVVLPASQLLEVR